jgi:hypothetical protein
MMPQLVPATHDVTGGVHPHTPGVPPPPQLFGAVHAAPSTQLDPGALQICGVDPVQRLSPGEHARHAAGVHSAALVHVSSVSHPLKSVRHR